jgi:hypothetical protein
MSATIETVQELTEEAFGIIRKHPSAHKIARPLSIWQVGTATTLRNAMPSLPGETVASLYNEGLAAQARQTPTIGLLLCKSAKKTVVEPTLPKDANIHAKECQIYLPSKELLKQKLDEWSAATSR